jgi:hypothetical protein
MEEGWKLNCILFLYKTHKPLHLDKGSLVQWKIINIATGSVQICILYVKSFKYVSFAKFCGYVWRNSEFVYVEFCKTSGVHICGHGKWRSQGTWPTQFLEV